MKNVIFDHFHQNRLFLNRCRMLHIVTAEWYKMCTCKAKCHFWRTVHLPYTCTPTVSTHPQVYTTKSDYSGIRVLRMVARTIRK